MIDMGNPNRPDYWFDVGMRWCWRCFRFTRHYGHTGGDPVCARCALMRDGTEKDRGKKKWRRGQGGQPLRGKKKSPPIQRAE